MSFSTWWGKPEYNGVKALLFVVLAAILGYFVYNYMHTGSLVGTGSVAQNTTSTAGPSIPAVSTAAASAITATSATLNATVSTTDASNTPTVTFVYGPTNAYGSSAQVSAQSGAVSAPVTGLKCNTKYFYRITAKNATGTSGGGEMTFNTKACGTKS